MKKQRQLDISPDGAGLLRLSLLLPWPISHAPSLAAAPPCPPLCSPLPRALHPAQVDEPAVWSELAHAYLEAGQVNEAIASYLRAADTSKYNEVIAKAHEVRDALCTLCMLAGNVS